MKKWIHYFLLFVCAFTLAACKAGSAGKLTGREVTGIAVDYDFPNDTILLSAHSGEEYALVIGSDSTITWENTEFFTKNELPLPAENDFDYLCGSWPIDFTITVVLGNEVSSVSHAFTEEAEICCLIDHIVVKAIPENLVIIPKATAAKPVIYLYPETETDVTVKLEYRGDLTCTYPAYKDGWSVTAAPDGTLTDAHGQTYNYLYWEGKTDARYDFSSGFCVAGSDTAAFLEDALAKLGLTRREANEFIVYWLPLMEENPWNLISFQTGAYTNHGELDISPAPDTLIRVFMAWKPLTQAVEIPAQELTGPERRGFTVIEWGGSQIE